MNKITDEMVLSTLREVVAEQPDFVYEPAGGPGAACLYVHTDPETQATTPGCVVGHVLAKLGVPLGDMQRYESVGAAAVVSRLGIDLAASTIALLLDTQDRQDHGMTWGEALTLATAEAAAE